MTWAGFIAVLTMGVMATMAVTVGTFAWARGRRVFYLFAVSKVFGALYALAILLHEPIYLPTTSVHIATRGGFLCASFYTLLNVLFLARYRDYQLSPALKCLGLYLPAAACLATFPAGLMFEVGQARTYHVLGIAYHAAVPTSFGFVVAGALGGVLCVLVYLAYRLRARFFPRFAVLLSLLLLSVTGVSDMATTLGVVDMPYLAHMSGVAISLSMAAQLAHDWGAEARQLIRLRRSLEEDIGVRSEELLAARDALAHKDRMAIMGRIAATVGHEINNPLTSMIINLEEVSAELDDENEHRPLVVESLDGARRIARIVEDLRPLAKRSSAGLKPVRLSEEVAAAVRTVRHRVRPPLEVRCEVPEDLYVLGDPTGLTQIFVNLINNALDAMMDAGQGTRVVIRAELEGERVHVRVSDDGPGLPPDLHPFEPFRGTTPDGLGLGLAIVKSLAEAFGGSVRVDMVPDWGTSFLVTLLRTGSEPPLRAEHPSDAETEMSRMSILVVDDKPEVASAIARLLHPAKVEIAVSGFAALERFRAERFDFVLCDVMMDGMSGLQVWERLAAIDGVEFSMVFMTGGVPTEAMREALTETGVPVLHKPFTRDAFLRSCRGLRSAALEAPN